MNNLEKRMSEISNQEKIAVDAILKRNSEILKFVEEPKNNTYIIFLVDNAIDNLLIICSYIYYLLTAK